MPATLHTMKGFLLLLAFSGLSHSFQFKYGLARPAGEGLGIGRNDRARTNVASTCKIRHAKRLQMTATSLSSKNAPNKKSNPPQLIEFIEPKTKVKVILVGTMHYNPTSVNMVKKTVDELGMQDALGSVVVESCDIRWNTTTDLLSTPRGKLLKPVLSSEMKAASDKALLYGRPVVLGDQRINATGTSIGNVFKQTVKDMASPLNGGWGRFYRDFKEAAEVALPTGTGYLSASSFLDPRLLIAAPVSFAKYPLSFLVRNPVSTSVVLSVLFGLGFLDNGVGGDFADANLEEQIESIVVSLLFAGLEIAFFGKILVQVLLAERNEVIAKNILDQCQIYSNVNNSRNNSGSNSSFLKMFSFLSGGNEGSLSSESETNVRGNALDSVKDGKEKAVVAVLGMAHCNGILKLLKEELV